MVSRCLFLYFLMPHTTYFIAYIQYCSITCTPLPPPLKMGTNLLLQLDGRVLTSKVIFSRSILLYNIAKACLRNMNLKATKLMVKMLKKVNWMEPQKHALTGAYFCLSLQESNFTETAAYTVELNKRN